MLESRKKFIGNYDVVGALVIAMCKIPLVIV